METKIMNTPTDEISTDTLTETASAPVANEPRKVEENWPGLDGIGFLEEDAADTVDTSDTSNTADTANTSNTANKLPDGYLSNGFMEIPPDGKNFLKRDYVDRYAKELASALTSGTPTLTAAAFRSAFLRDAKKLLRRGTPDGAKLTAVAMMQVQATKLVAQNKAPAILQQMIDKATAAVTDTETFHSLYVHLDSIYTFLLQHEQQKGGEF